MIKKLLIGAGLAVASSTVYATETNPEKLNFTLNAEVRPANFKAERVGPEIVTPTWFSDNGYPVFENLQVKLSGGDDDIEVRLGSERSGNHLVLSNHDLNSPTPDLTLFVYGSGLPTESLGISNNSPRQIASRSELESGKIKIVKFHVRNSAAKLQPSSGVYSGQLTLIFEAKSPDQFSPSA